MMQYHVQQPSIVADDAILAWLREVLFITVEL
jgi:hypothetical protein